MDEKTCGWPKWRGMSRCAGISTPILEYSQAFNRPSKTYIALFVLSNSRHNRHGEEKSDARVGLFERHVEPDFRGRRPGGGEDSAAGDGVRFPGRDPEGLWQTGAGAAQSVRPGGAALAVQYGAERHHRKRQLAHGRPDRRVHAAGGQLPGGAIPVSPPAARPAFRRQTDGAGGRRQDRQEGSVERIADARGADDGAAPPGIRLDARGGAVRAGTGRHVLRSGEDPAEGGSGTRRGGAPVGRPEREAGPAAASKGQRVKRRGGSRHLGAQAAGLPLNELRGQHRAYIASRSEEHTSEIQ